MNTATINTPRRLTELPTDMLERFRARAGELDQTNTYFHDDLAELRDVGYLAAAVPVHLGGWGLDLAQTAASQRRLARYAPATALSMTMHSYWIGAAAELERAGDSSQRWILEAAVDGEVMAAGHAETGNDIPVLLSTCRAERVEGGYRLTGRKQFGSNGPSWSWLGAHASTPTPLMDRRPCTPSSTAPAPVSRWSRRGTPSGCVRRRATTLSSTRSSSPTPASAGSCRRATAAIRTSWR
jgi:alkylation response protein AidB-like acyl-CoA dehydrogenase